LARREFDLGPLMQHAQPLPGRAVFFLFFCLGSLV
jgi:hypothetical protein